MKFVILSSCEIPGFGGARGPVLTPQEYDLHLVLRMITNGVDIREVMEDGSYRKLVFNDPAVMKAIDKGFVKDHKEEEKPPVVELVNKAKPRKKKEEPIKETSKEDEELAQLEKEIEALEKEENNKEIQIDTLEEM